MTYACRTGFEPAWFRLFAGPNCGTTEASEQKSTTAGTWIPAVDVTESPTSYVIEADLPGLKREDFEIEIVGDMLTLKGARKNEKTDESGQYRRAERRYGAFERSFNFEDKIDSDKVVARFENGVLQVTLPKPAKAQPKKVEVNVN